MRQTARQMSQRNEPIPIRRSSSTRIWTPERIIAVRRLLLRYAEQGNVRAWGLLICLPTFYTNEVNADRCAAMGDLLMRSGDVSDKRLWRTLLAATRSTTVK